MENNEVLKMVSALLEAKKNVMYCLNNPNGLADMHGLSYWANEVERMRKKVNDVL